MCSLDRAMTWHWFTVVFLSSSLESRDNPFLPGGELSREAEYLLSRATIIRDHFYLNEEEKRTLRQHQQEQEKQHRGGKHVQIVENPDDVARARGGSHPSTPPLEAVEERISPQMQANNLAAAAPASSPNGEDNHQLRPKENGRFKDASPASDNDKQAVPDGENQSRVPGHTETGSGPAQISGPADLQVREADKKKRNKCCTIM